MYRDVRRGRPGLAYFPAVSLSMNESMDVNFGDSPMRYPHEDYVPLTLAPVVEPAWKKSMEAFGRLCAFGGVDDPTPSRVGYYCRPEGVYRQSGTPELLTVDDEAVLACATLRGAGPLGGGARNFDPEWESEWLQRRHLVRGLIRVITREGERRRVCEYERTVRLLRVGLFDGRFNLDHDKNCDDESMAAGVYGGSGRLEHDLVNFSKSEYGMVVGELTEALAEYVRSTPFTDDEPLPAGYERSGMPSHAPLAFAAAIVRDETARSAWMFNEKWGKELEDFLTWKSPSPEDLAAMLPAGSVWWPGAGTSEAIFVTADGGDHPGGAGSEIRCKAEGLRLRACMSRSCAMHCGLIDAVWGHCGFGAKTGGIPLRGEFNTGYGHGVEWLTALHEKNIPGRSVPHGHRPSDPCIMGSLYFAMLALIRPELENPRLPTDTQRYFHSNRSNFGMAKWSPSGFYDSCAHQFDLPLFGGGVSHVMKTYPPCHSAPAMNLDVTALRSTSDAPVVDLADAGLPPLKFIWFDEKTFDQVQFLYHLAVGNQYKSAAFQLQAQIQSAKQLEEACKTLPNLEAEQLRHSAQTRIMTQLQVISDESSTRPPDEDASAAFVERLRGALTEATQLASHGMVSDDVAGAITAATRNLQDRYNVVLVDEENDSTAAADETREVASGFIGRIKEELIKLRDEVVDTARVCWWHRAVLHRPEQQAGMFAAAAYQAQVILAAMERGAEPRRLPSDSDNEDEGEGVDDDEGDEDVYEDTDESDEEGSVERENVDTDPEMDEDDGTDEDVDEDPGGGRPYDGRVPMTVDDGRVPGVDTRKGALLQHIPAYHLEVLIDSFHALRRGDPPFAPVAPARAAASPGLHGVVKLLVRHFADERVVNPDVRDVMLQSVSVLLQYKEYVAVFEANDEARREMVPALLRSFDSRFWIPVSNILLRLCKGVGFGQYDDRATKVLSAIKATKRVDGVDTPGLDSQRTDENIATNDGSEFGTSPDATLARAIATSVDSSSPLFRALIVDTFREDPKLLERFLDRVFNTLNWTITEFGVALKEMLDMRQRAAAARNLQRKCTVMLELSATLERVLEFLTLELPAAFLDSQASMRMKRLVEILLFVLGHTCGAGSDAKLFEQALSMKLPVFVADKISRAPILAPIAGIILNLEIAAMAWVEGRGDDFGVDEVSDTVADELAAGAGENNISQLEYVCAFDWETHFGSFTGREEAVMELRDVVRRVRDTRGDIERRRKAEDETDVPEEFVDPIMQSFMSDPVTLPGSGVVVDRETIRRHLLTGDGTDPFSRTPLDESMLVDATELRERIDEWRTGLHVTPPDTALEDVD